MVKNNSKLNSMFEIETALSLSEPLPAVDVWLVLDMLRASTTVVAWFERGGKELYPEMTIEGALALKAKMLKEGHSPLLMGEKDSVPPDGFDAGNSPIEIDEQIASRQPTAILATTNGTKAILKAVATGAAVYIVCARNALYALDKAITQGNHIGILCAGRIGRPSVDDTICAGLIIEKLCGFLPDCVISDAAVIALKAWKNSTGSFEHNIRSAVHAKFLERIGFSGDISYACEQDCTDYVPEVKEVPDFCEKGLRALITCERKDSLNYLFNDKEKREYKAQDIFFGGDSYMRNKSPRRKLDFDFGGGKI
jgi:2-phosphosulfolactate phosphatase